MHRRNRRIAEESIKVWALPEASGIGRTVVRRKMTKQAKNLASGSPFYVVAGRYEAKLPDDLLAYLEFLGSRLVFLIDWNRARKELRGFLRAPQRYLGDSSRRDKTHQHNTHITDVREICYSWHPWHGRAVRVHASLVKRGQAVAHCSLEDVQACRVLEVPLWMLDVAACCKTRASKPGFASAQSLRDLKEVLQAARSQIPNQRLFRSNKPYSII